MNSHHREFKTLRWFILVIVASKEWIQEDKNCLTTEHTTQVQSIWVVSSFWSVHNLLALYLKKKMTFGRVQKASFYTSVYRFWPICGRLGLKSTASRSIWLFLRQSLAPGSGGKVVATSHFIFRNPPTHSDPTPLLPHLNSHFLLQNTKFPTRIIMNVSLILLVLVHLWSRFGTFHNKKQVNERNAFSYRYFQGTNHKNAKMCPTKPTFSEKILKYPPPDSHLTFLHKIWPTSTPHFFNTTQKVGFSPHPLSHPTRGLYSGSII